MKQEIVFSSSDRIAVLAPHPDDECIGVAAVLIQAPDQADIYVFTDGSHGNKDRSIEEELVLRKKQFEAEMKYVMPHAWYWLGIEDTKLSEHPEVTKGIDFTKYTKIFLPGIKSLHPDHVAAAEFCINAIRTQGATAECYLYEVFSPFYNPSHYIDITDLEDEKRKLIRFHEDQSEQEEIALTLNAFRAAQMFLPQIRCVECFDRINV